MTKLLYLVTEAGYFFSHRYALAKAAQNKGFDIVVATKPGSYHQRLLDEGFRVSPLKKMTRSGLNPIHQILSIIEIYKIYKKENPDIVHHVAMKPVLYGSIAAQLSGIKNVVNAITGLGYLFISSSLKSQFLRFWIWISFHRLFRGAGKKVILQNKDDLSLFSKIVPKKNLVLIRGSGVDTKTFNVSKNKSKRTTLRIVLVARLLWDKGIKEMIGAVEILKQKEFSFEFILAGGLDFKNPSSISQSQINKWEKGGLCTWVGKMKDIASLYGESDIAALPSYREGLPKSLLEAAACGLPIVTTDVPGCREIVQHQKTGLLVPVRNVLDLADALEKLLKDENLRHRLGKEARLSVENHFSEDIIIKETLDVYTDLLKKSL